jgi:prevent-host-death family protein
MKSASVTELKANLSRYLRMVRRGSEVQILERGVPIAKLVALHGIAREGDASRLERLAKAGVLRRGTGDLGWATEEPPVRAKKASLSRALHQDREDRG